MDVDIWVISHFIKKGVDPSWVDSFLNSDLTVKMFYTAVAELELEEENLKIKAENIRHENIINCLGGKLR
ncbi:MAG: hypothetical protein ACRC78_22960 [Planktothrix sp.]